jgi:hypothetical protein
MSSINFGDLFDAAESGEVSSAVPAGTYDIVVSGARPLNPDSSSTIFLTLTVLNGPHQGTDVDVALYIPKPGGKAFASQMFGRKIKGFLAYPDVKAAGRAMDNAPSRDAGFDYLAEALTGKRASADIGVRTDGDYAGSNELKSTKPIEGGPQAVAAATAQPAAVPQPYAAQQQPVPQPYAAQQQPAQAAAYYSSDEPPF